jgi:hypothetical protein
MADPISFFDDFPVAAQTRHFIVTYAGEDDADARARAQAIGGTCENDLTKLEGWFSCNFDNSPYGIWVHVGPGKHLGGAVNTGYDNDQSSVITIEGTYTPPKASPNTTLRDEMARMLFVAELAEILMGFSYGAWDRGNSMGEGLSILAAETLHPTGYYGTGSGPRIKAWLQGSRPDYVTTSDETDTNNLSYGCAVLFLNYLRYQLGYSFDQIVAAAGSFKVLTLPVNKISLADVFSTLTGRPRVSAYKELTDLLQAHLPMGKPSPSPVRDNLFPLRAPNQRIVTFDPSEDELKAVQDPETLLIKRQAGPMCPPNVYTYHNVNVSSQLTLSGRAVGFAQPTFIWALNGAILNNSNTPQFTTVSMTATDTVPGMGEPAVVVHLPVKYSINSSGFTSALSIFNQAFPGNGALTISLSAVESLIDGDVPTNFTEEASILTRRYAMLGAWFRDVAACNIKDLSVINQTVKSLAHRMVEDDRPNPNPAVVRALANVTRKYVEALDAVTGRSRGLDLAVANIFKQLEDVRAPLESLTYHNSKTGLRVLRKLVEVPAQVSLQTTDGDTITANQSEE